MKMYLSCCCSNFIFASICRVCMCVFFSSSVRPNLFSRSDFIPRYWTKDNMQWWWWQQWWQISKQEQWHPPQLECDMKCEVNAHWNWRIRWNIAISIASIEFYQLAAFPFHSSFSGLFQSFMVLFFVFLFVTHFQLRCFYLFAIPPNGISILRFTNCISLWL